MLLTLTARKKKRQHRQWWCAMKAIVWVFMSIRFASSLTSCEVTKEFAWNLLCCDSPASSSLNSPWQSKCNNWCNYSELTLIWVEWGSMDVMAASTILSSIFLSPYVIAAFNKLAESSRFYSNGFEVNTSLFGGQRLQQQTNFVLQLVISHHRNKQNSTK